MATILGDVAETWVTYSTQRICGSCKKAYTGAVANDALMQPGLSEFRSDRVSRRGHEGTPRNVRKTAKQRRLGSSRVALIADGS